VRLLPRLVARPSLTREAGEAKDRTELDRVRRDTCLPVEEVPERNADDATCVGRNFRLEPKPENIGRAKTLLGDVKVTRAKGESDARPRYYWSR